MPEPWGVHSCRTAVQVMLTDVFPPTAGCHANPSNLSQTDEGGRQTERTPRFIQVRVC